MSDEVRHITTNGAAPDAYYLYQYQLVIQEGIRAMAENNNWAGRLPEWLSQIAARFA